MRNGSNIIEVGKLKPSYMGFIFYEKSKRFVGQNFTMPANLSNDIKKVGVFVNAALGDIRDVVTRHHLDYVQLHGNESVEICDLLRKNKVGVIKAFAVDGKFDFSKLSAYKNAVDFFLFDSPGAREGGNGVTFDWSRLEGYDQEIPFFIAGGISIANVSGISRLSEMNLHGVDVNSGVEDEPGLKNLTQVRLLIQKIEAI
jgi:phosphoribosylanthranilate isomerase